jgi:tetratricopeptide (TPR) repeat protein
MADEKDPKKPSAKEKIAEQRKMKDELSNALLAGRLAASTETATNVRVPGAAIDKASKEKKAQIPPPSRPKGPAQPPTGVVKKKAPPGPAGKVAKKPDVKPAPAKKSKARKVAWDPKRLARFVAGVITLGELEGISKDEQYEMAKLGHRLIKQGKLADAMKVFEGLVALDPRDAYFHMALGSIAQRSDQLEEAEERYTRALAINPYSPVALANRGEVRMMRGRMLEGAKDLMKALEEDPAGTEQATKRARATISVLLQQLREAGIDVGQPKETPKPKAPAAGPTKKAGVAAPPGKPAPRATARPVPRPRPGPKPQPKKK